MNGGPQTSSDCTDLTFTILWANSADDLHEIAIFIFFFQKTKNKIPHSATKM